MTPQDLAIMNQTVGFIILHALVEKGVLNYADIQSAIGVGRERIPKELYTPAVEMMFNIMEQTYQPGAYMSPLNPPDEPHP